MSKERQSMALSWASNVRQRGEMLSESLEALLDMSGRRKELEHAGRASGFMCLAHPETGVPLGTFFVGDWINLDEVPDLMKECAEHTLRICGPTMGLQSGVTEAVKAPANIYAFAGLPQGLNRVMAALVAYRFEDLDHRTALSLIGTEKARTFKKLFHR